MKEQLAIAADRRRTIRHIDNRKIVLCSSIQEPCPPLGPDIRTQVLHAQEYLMLPHVC